MSYLWEWHMSSTYVRSVHSHACQNGCIFMWFEDLFVLSLCESVFPHILSWVQRLSSWAVHVGARLRCVNDLHNYYSGEDDVFLFQIMWMRISLCSHVYATKMSCCSVRKLESVATKQLFVQLNWSLFLCFDLYVITLQHWCYIHFAHIIQSVYLQDVKIGEKGTEDNFVELG